MMNEKQKVDTTASIGYLANKLVEAERTIALYVGIVAEKDKEIEELKNTKGE